MSGPTSPHPEQRVDGGARNQSDSICLVVNPRAGAGRAGRELERLERLVERSFETWAIRPTQGPGHGRELARQAADDGFDIVAAVGGDGTCHEVVNGLMTVEGDADSRPVFTVVPFGTGSDLIRSLSIPKDTSRALWIASTGITLRSDVGWVRTTNEQGELAERWFINEISFGMGGEVVARVNASSKRFGGFATFLGATVGTLVSFQPQRAHLRWEGPEGDGEWEGDLMNAFVANGHYCGGGMLVGKDGSMFDGQLDLTVLPPLGPLSSAANLPRLYRGSSHHAPGAFRVAIHSLEARCTSPTGGRLLVDSDGEQPGLLPLSARVIPAALQVRGGWRRSPIPIR
jgi:diacylglycerol kinase (ATP)